MTYYNYHGTIKKMINEGKLVAWYYTKKHNKISHALVLVFDDIQHPIMPIREKRWKEYEFLLPDDLKIQKD